MGRLRLACHVQQKAANRQGDLAVQLYTIVIDEKPILVIPAGINDAGDKMAMEVLAGHPEGLKAFLKMKALYDSLGEEFEDQVNLREVEEGIEGPLGRELQTLLHNGKPIWDGDRSRLGIRKAQSDETARWRRMMMRESADEINVFENPLPSAVYLIPMEP